uniref:Uncharacterized protein n=1 Tax=Hyaloperonospora arabidopsidis (strain Emoy2) TaxID=559515 RepID=M4B5R8_HYAAE
MPTLKTRYNDLGVPISHSGLLVDLKEYSSRPGSTARGHTWSDAIGGLRRHIWSGFRVEMRMC